MEIRKRWVNLLHKVATGTAKTCTVLTPMFIPGYRPGMK
jgi:hypothetical protein